jgi:hypothetical protein
MEDVDPNGPFNFHKLTHSLLARLMFNDSIFESLERSPTQTHTMRTRAQPHHVPGHQQVTVWTYLPLSLREREGARAYARLSLLR